MVTREPVKDSDVPELVMQGVIEAPPEKVWPLIDDCGAYDKHMARIGASKQLERDGGRVVCRVTAQMPFPLSDLTAETVATHAVEPGVRWSRTWTLLKGDYKLNDGSWVLTPFRGDPKRTLAVYQIHVEPKVPLPDALIRSVQARALPDVMEKLRALVKEP